MNHHALALYSLISTCKNTTMDVCNGSRISMIASSIREFSKRNTAADIKATKIVTYHESVGYSCKILSLPSSQE